MLPPPKTKRAAGAAIVLGQRCTNQSWLRRTCLRHNFLDPMDNHSLSQTNLQVTMGHRPGPWGPGPRGPGAGAPPVFCTDPPSRKLRHAPPIIAPDPHCSFPTENHHGRDTHPAIPALDYVGAEIESDTPECSPREVTRYSVGCILGSTPKDTGVRNLVLAESVPHCQDALVLPFCST